MTFDESSSSPVTSVENDPPNYQHRTIVCREENLKFVSILQELQDIVRQQKEIATKVPERDPPSFARAKAILHVGHHLLNKKSVLLRQVYTTYEKA